MDVPVLHRLELSPYRVGADRGMKAPIDREDHVGLPGEELLGGDLDDRPRRGILGDDIARAEEGRRPRWRSSRRPPSRGRLVRARHRCSAARRLGSSRSPAGRICVGIWHRLVVSMSTHYLVANLAQMGYKCKPPKAERRRRVLLCRENKSMDCKNRLRSRHQAGVGCLPPGLEFCMQPSRSAFGRYPSAEAAGVPARNRYDQVRPGCFGSALPRPRPRA